MLEQTLLGNSRRRVFLFTSALCMAPWTLVHAQGKCSASGMTLEEALAAWQDAQKKSQMDKDSFLVTIERKSKALFKGKKGNADVEEMGVLGTLSVNGVPLGDVVENEVLRIKPGTYRGVLRYVSGNNFVQGPLGAMSESGDFLLEVAGVNGRSNLLIHTGTKPWHSEGCILAGAAKKTKVNGKDLVTISDDTTLRKMRMKFYGVDQPKACPNKTVQVSIKDI
jgi:hypothetical protein